MRTKGTCLLVVAAAGEGRAVLRAFGGAERAADRAWELHRLGEGYDLVVSGIGKANAAGAVGRCADPRRHGMVVSVGVAGALPGPRVLPLGAVVCATHCVFADEGVETPGRFVECAEIGFPIAGAPFEGNRARVSAAVLKGLTLLADRAGPVATVSTCSGTDERARAVAVRTGAVAEAMEGAAVATAAVRLGLQFGEVRVISNTTGDREKQVWDIKGALSRLTDVIGRMRGKRAEG